MTVWSLYPIFTLVGLMVVLWWTVASRRIVGARAGRASLDAILLGNQQDLPRDLILPGRNYDNLMQQPVLFGVLMLMIFQLQLQSPVLMGLSWCFVIGRIWHSIEHLRANSLVRRTWAFALSSLSHWIAWIWVLQHIVRMSIVAA